MAMIRLTCVLALLWGAGAWAASRPTVVELYTSEGCSSCPPADQLLGTLARRPDVLALAFHVGYWDSLGWPDRFALPYADQRQSRYAHQFALASVFTPQMVVDGQHSFIGSDQRGILPAIASHDGIAISIEARAEQLQVDVGAGSMPAAAEVLLLALLPETQTAIGRGENSGRTLREVNVVRASFALGRFDGSARRYTLARSALPADASSAAVLIQQDGQRAMLGAAMVALH